MIDKNEAPEGYEAVKFDVAKGCSACAFYGERYNELCENTKCDKGTRADSTSVHFIEKKKAELQFPYGSCGEY